MTDDDFRPRPRPWLGPGWLARVVARSLLSDPASWDTSGRHVWAHRSGVSLWVANEAHGMGLSCGHNRRAEPHDGGLSAADRRHIWRAAKRVLADNRAVVRAQAERALAPFGRGVS